MATKVSLIGAGSASFGLDTSHDIARSEELHGSTVALVDVVSEALKLMHKAACEGLGIGYLESGIPG